MKNIYDRLCLTYGEDFRFDIASAPGQGTRIAIDIPCAAPDQGRGKEE